MQDSEIKKSGYIALLGRPNMGKSTLLNYLNGSDLAITSYKPQTTRNLIRLVLREGDSEMIFLDTPGIHSKKHALDRYMSKAISLAMSEADIFLLLIEAGFQPRVELAEKALAQFAKEQGKKLFLVLNKLDKVPKEHLLPLIAAYDRELQIDEFIPLSAKTGEGVELLLDLIKQYLPEGEAKFTVADYTNQSERVLAAELIRQQLLLQMQEEIPHGTAVQIDEFEEVISLEDGLRRLSIRALIICERANHKAMILGKQGKRIKQIRQFSQKRIAEILGDTCDLELYVLVKEDWRRKTQLVQEIGYDIHELDLD